MLRWCCCCCFCARLTGQSLWAYSKDLRCITSSLSAQICICSCSLSAVRKSAFAWRSLSHCFLRCLHFRAATDMVNTLQLIFIMYFFFSYFATLAIPFEKVFTLFVVVHVFSGSASSFVVVVVVTASTGTICICAVVDAITIVLSAAS